MQDKFERHRIKHSIIAMRERYYDLLESKLYLLGDYDKNLEILKDKKKHLDNITKEIKELDENINSKFINKVK